MASKTSEPEGSKQELENLQTETQRAAARNKLVVLAAVVLYIVLVASSIAILPQASTELALIRSRKALVPHWCGFSGFFAVFFVELVSFMISTDAAKTRVMVITLACSLMGCVTYLLLALEISPVILGPASGFPVYPTKMLTWIVSTSLMIYVVWNAGDTPVSHLLRTLAYNATMLVAGLVGFCSPVQYVPVAFACGMVMFCGMGYGQWTMIDQSADDDRGMHRANTAMFNVKCIMAACWLLFPAIYALQFFGIVPDVILEAAMTFADVLAKCILMSSIQQGFLCGSADRKQQVMQQMALDLVADLKEADKKKDRFVATMTHELRTPLNGIVGITESLLLNYSETMDERVVKGITTVRDSGKRFSQLVSNILDSASVSESKLRLVFAPVNFSEIVDEVALLIEPLLRNNTKLIVDVPPSLPTVDADYDRLLQIMFNLLGNACKFTDFGEISVRATSTGGMLRIEVRDTGAGIPSDKHNLIFKPFEQADNSRTRVHGGSGLGLSLARSLVEAHDGTLTVRSEVKKGSTFTTLIPLKSKRTQAKTEVIGSTGRGMMQSERELRVANKEFLSSKQWNLVPESPDNRSPARFAPKHCVSRQMLLPSSDDRPDNASILHEWLASRKEEAVSCFIRTELEDEMGPLEVLLVDDEEQNHVVVKELLNSTGMIVTCVHSGDEAIELLQNRFDMGGSMAFPAIALMDLMMPGITGQQTMEVIREKFPRCQMPIIMLSANSDETTMVKALQNGCQDYIVKPFKSAELLARVGLQTYSLKKGVKQIEQKLVENLLSEILPDSIIKRLKDGQHLIADKLSSATVVSFGLTGLETICGKLGEVKEYVTALDEVFSMLDATTDYHGLSKVEALGGASIFTVVAGHEERSFMDHAQRAIRLVRDVLNVAPKLKITQAGICIRIGIHSGPVVAGMIGCKAPRYFVTGDTLEISSHLEAGCHASCAQMSEHTVKLLEKSNLAKKVTWRPFGKGRNLRFSVPRYLLEIGDWESALQEQESPSAVDASQITAPDTFQSDSAKAGKDCVDAQACPTSSAQNAGSGLASPVCPTAVADAENCSSPSQAIQRSPSSLFACFRSPRA